MGKKIVIKGADFSENGVHGRVVYLNAYTMFKDYQKDSAPNKANGGWTFIEDNGNPCSELINKTINWVRFVPIEAGTFNIYRCSDVNNSSKTLICSIQITSADVGNVKTVTFDEVTLGNEYLVFGEANDNQGCPTYAGGAGVPALKKWYNKVPSNGTVTRTASVTGGICIDVGYQY